jgi:putative Mg2+ transporter-C (MgtC) family protein
VPLDLRGTSELLLRIAVATVLGAVIGYERDIHGRPAGLRTHALVALASATFMVVSGHFVFFQHYVKGDVVEVDASRIAASVVSGIGFLAGGAILRTGLTVQGLTTAAALWLVAAIGLAAGGGMYVVAVFATATGVAALTVLRRFEDKQVLQRRMILIVDGKVTRGGELLAALKRLGVSAAHVDYDYQFTEGRLTLTFDARFSTSLGEEAVVAAMETQPGVQKVRLASTV